MQAGTNSSVNATSVLSGTGKLLFRHHGFDFSMGDFHLGQYRLAVRSHGNCPSGANIDAVSAADAFGAQFIGIERSGDFFINTPVNQAYG